MSTSQSSPSSSSRHSSTVNTAETTPFQSPASQSRFQSSTWSGSSKTRRSRKLSDEAGKTTMTANGNGSNGKRHHTQSFSTPTAADNSKGFSVPFRTSSNTNDRSISISRDQWWENVLPPGQLAERLRRAQGISNDGRSDATTTEEGPRSSRMSILRNATPSERKTWSSLADLGRGGSRTVMEQNRSEANSSRSSIASLPSTKSDYFESMSGGSSSAEGSPQDGRSPTGHADMDQRMNVWDRSGTMSPPLAHSISRSTTCRRSRVMGDNNDNGIGLGIGTKGTQVSDLDERFRQWNSNLPFQSSTNHHASHPLLRPFPSTTGGRTSPAHVLADTPEVSSEEDQGDDDTRSSTTTTTTRTTRRIIKTSLTSLRSFKTLEEMGNRSKDYSRPSMPIVMPTSNPSSRRTSWTTAEGSSTSSASHSRHVSFNHAVEVSSDEQRAGYTIGRHAGRSHSMLNDTGSNKRSSWHPESFSTSSTKPFPTSTSEAKLGAPAAGGPQISHLRGRRMACYSAPTSPNLTHRGLPVDDKRISSSREETRMTSPSPKDPLLSNLPDLALLSSFNIGQTQLATSAGNLALNFTRQLSIPLRPMLHLTVFLSVSSFTFMALAGFLIAGYMVTAWDDVNNQGKTIHNKVSSATSWCGRLLGGSGVDASEEESSSTTTDQHGSNSTTTGNGHQRSSSHMVIAPIRLALAVPATIAYKLTPTAISESFGLGAGISGNSKASDQPSRPSSHDHGRTNSRSNSPNNTTPSSSSRNSLPPRPPLSSLLPSIFLTILIALGAGLVSFFAERSTNLGPTSTTTSSRSSPATTASMPHHSSRIPSLHKRSSQSSQHGSSRRQSYPSQSHDERQPYDLVY